MANPTYPFVFNFWYADNAFELVLHTGHQRIRALTTTTNQFLDKKMMKK